MKYLEDESGSVALVVALVVSLLLFFGATGFGAWAFLSRQDYKQNVDEKIKAALVVNTKEVQAKDALEYAEAAKQPLKTYIGPEAFGSIHVQYPRTWSSYVVTTTGQPLDFYAQPDFVPSVTDKNSSFALRVQVTAVSYNQVVQQFQGLLKQGKVSASPYALPKNPTIVGLRIDGQITNTKQGSMIILPLRDKTLKLWTESSQSVADFNNNILPNTSFSP